MINQNGQQDENKTRHCNLTTITTSTPPTTSTTTNITNASIPTSNSNLLTSSETTVLPPLVSPSASTVAGNVSSAAVTFTASPWLPFSESVGEQINEHRAWCIVGDFQQLVSSSSSTSSSSSSLISAVCSAVDSILADVACSQQISSSLSPSPSTSSPSMLNGLKVLFTDPAHIETFGECSAVHGNPFMLCSFDCDADASYVCADAFHRLVHYCYWAAQQQQQHQQLSSSASSSTSVAAPPPLLYPPPQHITAPIKAFIGSVVANQCPKAPQGQRPPMHLKPCDSLGLTSMLKAVSATYVPLVYEPLVDVATIVYSNRCPCCPDVIWMVDHIVAIINKHREREEGEPVDPVWSDLHHHCTYSPAANVNTNATTAAANASNTGAASPAAAAPIVVAGGRSSLDDYSFEDNDNAASVVSPNGSAHPHQQQQHPLMLCPSDLPCYTPTGKVSTRMRVVLCNIDENDLCSPLDWPSESCDQIVPHIRFYAATDLRKVIDVVRGANGEQSKRACISSTAAAKEGGDDDNAASASAVPATDDEAASISSSAPTMTAHHHHYGAVGRPLSRRCPYAALPIEPAAMESLLLKLTESVALPSAAAESAAAAPSSGGAADGAVVGAAVGSASASPPSPAAAAVAAPSSSAAASPSAKDREVLQILEQQKQRGDGAMNTNAASTTAVNTGAATAAAAAATLIKQHCLPMGSREYYEYLRGLDAAAVGPNDDDGADYGTAASYYTAHLDSSTTSSNNNGAGAAAATTARVKKVGIPFDLSSDDRSAVNVAKFFLKHARRTRVDGANVSTTHSHSATTPSDAPSNVRAMEALLKECEALDDNMLVKRKKRGRSNGSMATMGVSPSGSMLDQLP